MRIRIRSSLALVGTLAAVSLAVSVVTLAASASASASASAAARTPAARAAKLSPPVIHESFSPMACTGAPGHRSTLQNEGCAEQQILRSDKKIDALNRTIFTILPDNAARRRFIAGHKAWLGYRRAFCLSRSDIFEGGTDAAVVDATCVASINGQHVNDLKRFASDLTAE